MYIYIYTQYNIQYIITHTYIYTYTQKLHKFEAVAQRLRFQTYFDTYLSGYPRLD